MNIELIVVGKTDMKEVEALVTMYSKRLNHYVKFAITTLADVRNTKNLSTAEQKRMEGEAILRLVTDSDHLMLLDEHGLGSNFFNKSIKLSIFSRSCTKQWSYKFCTTSNNIN